MKEPGPVYVLGAGGHAKVVIATLQDCGFEVRAAFDDDPSLRGCIIGGVPVAGPIAEITSAPSPAAILAIGDNHRRQELAALLPDVRWMTAVHPRACVHPSVRLGQGSVVFAGAVIQPDAIIGRHTIVNTAATVDHDCVVGDFAHVAPGAHVAGTVRIGAGTLIGIGSCVAPGLTVGDWCCLGAGAVLVRDLPAGSVAFGVPARIRS